QGRLDLRVDHIGQSYVGRGTGRVELAHGKVLELAIDDTRYAEETLSLGRVQLTLGSASARLSGEFQPKGRVGLRADVSVPELRPIAELVTTEAVDGKLELHAAVSGMIEKPVLAIDGRYEGERALGLQSAKLELHARADVAKRTLELATELRARNTDARL